MTEHRVTIFKKVPGLFIQQHNNDLRQDHNRAAIGVTVLVSAQHTYTLKHDLTPFFPYLVMGQFSRDILCMSSQIFSRAAVEQVCYSHRNTPAFQTFIEGRHSLWRQPSQL